MKTTLFLRKCAFLILCTLGALSIQAQTLFETNFNAAEGWVLEGTAASTAGLLERTIIYNGTPFLFKCNQVAINPADAATGNCSMGSANIQKNSKSDYLQVSTTVSNGYILLPDFNADIQVSFARSNGTARRIAIETSADGGVTWQVKEDDIAPLLAGGCEVFKSPSKFAQGTRVRITNHTNGGGLKIYWLKVEAYTADLVPPTVIASNPDVNTIEITPSIRSISLTFSEPVKSGGDGKCYVVGNTSGNTLELTSDGLTYSSNIVTIPFSSSFFLNPNETYTVQIEKGCIKDLANNPAELISWNFTTKVSVSSDKEIISVSIPKMVGTPVINSAAGTIAIQLVAGSDLANIQPASIIFGISPLAIILNDYKNFASGPQTYQVTAEDRSVKNWVITITLADYKVATLPVTYLGSTTNSWINIVADGWTNYLINATSGLPNADTNTKFNNYSFYQASFSHVNLWVENNFTGVANRVSFRARYGNNTSNYQVDLQESPDGTTWTSIKSFIPTAVPDPTPMLPTTSSTLGLRSYPVQPTSQFIRWFYTTRSNTSFYLDDVVIENAPVDNVAPTFLSDQPVVSRNYSTNSKSQIVFKLSETVKVSQDLINRTTGIHVTAGAMDSVLYEPRILTLRTGEVVLTDFPALIDQTVYTVTVPGNALVDLAENPFAGTTFQFTYVISGIDKNVADQVTIIRQGENLTVSGAKTVQIYNTLGTLLLISKKNSISVGNLHHGIYLIRYSTESGVIGTTKVLLNN